MENVLAQITSREPTPEGLEVLTPAPSPITPPTALEIPERFLRGISDYICASSESGTWVPKSNDLYCRSKKDSSEQDGRNLDRFFNSVKNACFLFAEGKAQEAGQSLLYGTAAVKKLIESEHQEIFPQVLIMLQDSLENGFPEVAIAVTQQLVSWGEFLLGRYHPIPQLLFLFTNKDTPQTSDFVRTGLRSMRDCFDGQLGFYHEITQRISNLYYEAIPSSENRLHLLRSDLDRLMLRLPDWDSRCLGIHLDLVQNSISMGMYETAEDECIKILRACYETGDGLHRAYYGAHVSRYQAIVQQRRKNYDAAETLWNKAIAQSITVAGERRSTPQKWRRSLEKLLVRTGQVEKAALIEQQRMAVIARQLEELQEIEGPLAEL